MVYAFVLHTIASNEVQILYYKFYTCYGLSRHEGGSEVLNLESDVLNSNTYSEELDEKVEEDITQTKVLFESITEKKALLNYVTNKVHMHYSLKLKQALIPLTSVENDTKITGIFKERNWKNQSSEEFIVVWQGVKGFGFTLLCKKNENTFQAQNLLDTLIIQLEKQIKFLTEPLVAVKLIETVSLIVNNYIPGGQILFLNSKMLKSFEKKLELDLYAK